MIALRIMLLHQLSSCNINDVNRRLAEWKQSHLARQLHVCGERWVDNDDDDDDKRSKQDHNTSFSFV
jgi:hypothetical protein